MKYIVIFPFLFIGMNFIKILGGFFSITFSTTIVYFGSILIYVYFLVIASSLDIRKRKLTLFIFLNLLISMISFFINISTNVFDIDLSAYIFSYISTSMIFLIPLIISSQVRSYNILSYYDLFYRFVFFFYTFNIIVSLIEIYIFYVIKIPYEVIYLNPMLNSIIMTSVESLRIFGIFNSGGANGFFILFGIILFHNENRKIKGFLKTILIFSGIVVIGFTFTRKIYLMLFLLYYLHTMYFFLKNNYILRSAFLNLFILLNFMFGLLLIIFVNKFAIFDIQSIYIRLDEWEYFFSLFMEQDLFRIFFGWHLTQASFELINIDLKYDFIDNMLLAILIYYGLFGLFMYIIFIISLVYVYFKNIMISIDSFNALSLLLIFFFHGLFSTTWSSYDVSIYVYTYLVLVYYRKVFIR